MKRIMIVLSITGILFSCNPSNTTEKQNVDTTASKTAEKDTNSTAKEENENFKEINSDEALIATALMAAPKESRAKCKVIGYNMEGKFVALKEGDNEFICLSDDPKQEGFNAACYHKNLLWQGEGN